MKKLVVAMVFTALLVCVLVTSIFFILTNHAKNSPTSIGGEMNWHKKLSLDHRKKIAYT